MLKHGGCKEVDVLDFSVNINPIMDEQVMKPLLNKYAKAIHTYPEIEGESLVECICELEGIPAEHIIVGNGAIECLYLLARSLKPATVIIVEPTFSEYKRAFEIVGSQVLPLVMDMNCTHKDMERKLSGQIRKIKPDLVVICNPNNPTGYKFSEGFIEAISVSQRVHKGFVLIDESFRQFEGIPTSFECDKWNVIVLTSLTKYYGVAGLRAGYIMATKSVIEGMKAQQLPWSVNGLAVKIVPELMRDTSLVLKTNTWYSKEKLKMIEALNALAYIVPMESNANYICCRLESVEGKALNKWLLEQEPRMAIRTCDEFIGLSPYYIRIGLKDTVSNEILMTKLKEYEEVMTWDKS